MPMQSDSKIGLIAGAGDLPQRVIEEYLKTGREIFVISIGATPPESLGKVPHIILPLGSVGKAIKSLRCENVKDIVFAGAIKRPNFKALRPDAGGMKLLAKVSAAKFSGDNSLLAIVIKFFEDSGFNVVGVDQILSSLLMPFGVLGKMEPNKSALRDIDVGMDVARAVGNLDVGQSVVVQHGNVIGVEAVEGTDALMHRCAKLQTEGGGGVLVKMKKPVQDKRVDLPTIGVTTIINAYNANLRGLAIEAGAALIVDKDNVVEKADSLGLFVVGV